MALLELAESSQMSGVVGLVGSGSRFGALAVRVCRDAADSEAVGRGSGVKVGRGSGTEGPSGGGARVRRGVLLFDLLDHRRQARRFRRSHLY